MSDLSEEILKNYQVRRTKKQKIKFINFLKQHVPNLKIEEGGFLHNRNIIVGDVESAKVIVSAHYDTCALLPFPNFVAPKNPVLSILYSFIMLIPLCLFMSIVLIFVKDFYIAFNIAIILFFIVFFIGIPNKHTSNDNTSGVITLCELIMSMSEEEKKNVAFVFFDNEENGLFGSMFFSNKHKKIMKDKLLINVDCVSDGNHVLIIENKKTIDNYHDIVENTFKSTNNMFVYIENSKKTYYPSDQLNFPMYIAISTLNKGKFGLYIDKIHTNKDIIFERSNIEYVSSGIKEVINEISNNLN